MSGMVEVRSGRRFLFRWHEGQWLLWDVKSDPSRGRTDKMEELPHGRVEIFDLDAPPSTVSFQPVLSMFV